MRRVKVLEVLMVAGMLSCLEARPVRGQSPSQDGCSSSVNGYYSTLVTLWTRFEHEQKQAKPPESQGLLGLLGEQVVGSLTSDGMSGLLEKCRETLWAIQEGRGVNFSSLADRATYRVVFGDEDGQRLIQNTRSAKFRNWLRSRLEEG